MSSSVLMALFAQARPAALGLTADAAGVATGVAAGLAEAQKQMTEAAVAEVTPVLLALQTKISDGLVNIAQTKASLAKLEEAQTKYETANSYAISTGNIFPARKAIGLNTPANILSLDADVDKIPDGWTPTAAAPAPTAA